MGLGYYRGKHSKFSAIPDRCRQDYWHQSKLETKRCNELHIMQLADPPIIQNLEAHPQPRFDFVINDVKVCAYIADFRYFDLQLQREVVEDTKGHRTDVYKIKKKLMLAVFGIEVEEVRR